MRRCEPTVGRSTFVGRYIRDAGIAAARWLAYGNRPSEDGRSALLLAQFLQMLNVAEGVLSHYGDVVFGNRILPPLQLANEVRRRLTEDGSTPLTYLMTAVVRSPNYAEAWCELGRFLLQAGRTKEAIRALRAVHVSASYADPDRQPEHIYRIVDSVYVRAWYYMGQAYEKQGDGSRAIRAYAEALILQPRCPPVALALAELQLKRGAVRESFTSWRDAIWVTPVVVALPRVGRDLLDLPEVIDHHLRRVGFPPRAAKPRLS